jgi:hypothetical protein
MLYLIRALPFLTRLRHRQQPHIAGVAQPQRSATGMEYTPSFPNDVLRQ